MASNADAADVADQAEGLKRAFLGLTLAMPVLLDPRLHLLDIYCRFYGQSPHSPLRITRKDGSLQSSTPLRVVFEDVASDPRGGLREDVLAFAAMHGATRLGDELTRRHLMSTTEPLLQFARHLRNACAHGNRWHFRKGEPRHPAALRGYALDASDHGKTAIWGTISGAEYLDFLDDLATLLRSRR